MIRRAYADGVRAFVEIGPGASCTRMIDSILADQPHLAVAACPNDREPVGAVLWTLARLIAERFPVDLASLYGGEPIEESPRGDPKRMIRVPVGGKPFHPPAPPVRRPVEKAEVDLREIFDEEPEPVAEPVALMSAARPEHLPSGIAMSGNGNKHGRFAAEPVPVAIDRSGAGMTNPLTRQWVATDGARAGAHSAFLQTSGGIDDAMARQIAFQMELIGRIGVSGWEWGESLPPVDVEEPGNFAVEMPPRSLDRAACLRFAVGGIGEVLGPDFAAIDAHPTRVRLPDEPLMLVDRITTIEGEPRSMGSGATRHRA